MTENRKSAYPLKTLQLLKKEAEKNNFKVLINGTNLQEIDL